MNKLKELYLQNYKILNFIILSEQQKLKVLNWRNNSNIRKYMYNDNLISIDEHNNFINKLINDDENFYWLVEDIGVIYLNKVSLINRDAFIGIYKNPTYTGIGAGKALINCLINIGFNVLNLHTLKLEVLENNLIAINFYKKNNFLKEGLLKKHILKNNVWENIVIMGKKNPNE